MHDWRVKNKPKTSAVCFCVWTKPWILWHYCYDITIHSLYKPFIHPSTHHRCIGRSSQEMAWCGHCGLFHGGWFILVTMVTDVVKLTWCDFVSPVALLVFVLFISVSHWWLDPVRTTLFYLSTSEEEGPSPFMSSSLNPQGACSVSVFFTLTNIILKWRRHLLAGGR